MTHWPDGTPKSSHNVFNWRDMSYARKAPKTVPIAPRSRDLNAKSNVFQTYTKATAATGNFPPVAISRGERGSATTPTQA